MATRFKKCVRGVYKRMKKLALTLFFFTLTAQATDKKLFKVLGQDKGEIVLMPYTTPILGVKQISGPEIPKSGSLSCRWVNQKNEKDSYFTDLVGHCDGGITVKLVSLDLNQ
jgi:hypothetical protein